MVKKEERNLGLTWLCVQKIVVVDRIGAKGTLNDTNRMKVVVDWMWNRRSERVYAAEKEKHDWEIYQVKGYRATQTGRK